MDGKNCSGGACAAEETTAFQQVFRGLNRRQTQVVTGLRRVGKSTIVFQIIQQLINEQVDPMQIVYINFDDPDARKQGLVNSLKQYSSLTNQDYRKGKLYLFVDEAQKYSNGFPKSSSFTTTIPT